MKYLVLLLFCTTASAADITLSWVSSSNTTGYRVYQSIDNGITWGQVADETTLPIVVTVPDTGLVLLYVESYNGIDGTPRRESGFYYNGDWALPVTPANVMMQ